MVDSSNLNGMIATADDLEKGEVSDSERQQEDLEEGEEVYDTEEGDLEKRGEGYATEVPDLLEPLLTPAESQNSDLEAASKPLILTEKIIVSLLVVCFVLVEAYFVGRSFRHWHNDEHLHDGGNSTDTLEVVSMSLPLETPRPVPIDGGFKQGIVTPEPFEDFLEGSLDSGVGTVSRRLLWEAPVSNKVPPGVLNVDPELLVLPLMKEKKHQVKRTVLAWDGDGVS